MNTNDIITKAVEAMDDADRVTSKRLTYRDFAEAAFPVIEHGVRVDEFARSIGRMDALVVQIAEGLRSQETDTGHWLAAADFIEREFGAGT